MTRSRAAVLEALSRAEGPLSAAGVLAAIGEACDQATVYRALEHLADSGLAECFVMRCAAEGTGRYYVDAGRGHRHWMHCESCHAFVDLGECELPKSFAAIESRLGVKVTGHSLYLSGVCADCRRVARSRAGR